MTLKPNPPRAEFVRQRRSRKSPLRLTQTPKRASRPVSDYVAVTPRRPVTPPRTARTVGRQMRGRSYDIAFSLGRADVRAPALSLPQFGTRWISALGTALLGFMLYTLWTSSAFAISGAELRGNQRIDATEINASLQLVGEPIFKAVPAKIEANLHADYPDLASVKIHVGFPNRVVVDVVERTPVLAWFKDQAVTWIDANGVAFLPRGAVQGLIPVVAKGTPLQVPTDAVVPIYARPFIAPDMVQAMVALYPYVPQGVSMTYDPKYGMGWQDTRGWSVYFGQSTQDIPMKLHVYQAIVDTFTRQGIQPSLISVEYLDAPFYK